MTRRSSVPTSAAATLALRTQQVVAFETGVLSVADPLGGSYEVESRTDACATRILAVMDDIAARGGALACIESGYMRSQLGDAAYRQQRSVENGDRTVVGINRFPTATESLEVFAVDPAMEAERVAHVRRVCARRSASAASAALGAVTAAAASPGANVVPACVEAMEAQATIGEVVTALRQVFGSWRPDTEL
jgi:methylmalonyl-CoA mutase, N-terminal domain